jgi:HlyD family secretion protein
MFRKYGIPLLAAIGIIFTVWRLVQGNKPVPPAKPVAQPSRAPFSSYIAGAGMIEAKNQNIAIGAPVSGLIMQVMVKVGDQISKADPLFKLDDRSQQAALIVNQAVLRTAREQLNRLLSLPRPEDIPPVEAKVRVAESLVADAKNQLALAESVTDKRAISKEEVDRRRYAVQKAEANLSDVQAQFTELKAGAWKPDIEIARAALASAQSQIKSTETEIERLVVRAPIDGEILQVNVRAGEFAQAGVLATPLMLMGDLERLNVRIDIDENDAWRFRKDSRAVAYVRGNNDLQTKLDFEYIEPYVVPKRSLTGDSSERVDTRVFQVIYSFNRHTLPVYIGQIMDVFIEAPPIVSAESAPAATGREDKS